MSRTGAYGITVGRRVRVVAEDLADRMVRVDPVTAVEEFQDPLRRNAIARMSPAMPGDIWVGLWNAGLLISSITKPSR